MDKKLDVMRAEMEKKFEVMRAWVDTKIGEVKSELSRTIYIVGLVQFLAIVGSLLGVITFTANHLR